jgi:drug/metabolite transporter (DMT)-like permease
VDNAASTPLARRHDPRGLIAIKTLSGGAVVLVAALLFAGPPGGAPLDWTLALGAGVVGVALSSVLFYVALARIGAARTTMLFATSALWGVAFAAVLLRETLGPLHLLAAVLVALGIAALGWRAATA